MKIAKRIQRVSALAFIVLVSAPMSLIAESRRLSETELRRMAEELSAILGAGNVRIERRSGGTELPQSERSRGEARPERVASSPFDQQAILDEMNRHRRQAGRPPLQLDTRLSRAAGDRVGHMFQHGYFNHVSPDGVQPFVWLPKRGYRYATAGENLASGYQTAHALVEGWMSSPSHRANILGNYEEVGLAAANAAPVRRMSGPLVVAMYATER
jgi:uncharacterized protein YkwD